MDAFCESASKQMTDALRQAVDPGLTRADPGFVFWEERAGGEHRKARRELFNGGVNAGAGGGT